MSITQNTIIFSEIIIKDDLQQLQSWCNELKNIAENTKDKTTFNVALKFYKQYELITQMFESLRNNYVEHIDEVSTWNLEQWQQHELLKKELEHMQQIVFTLAKKYFNEKAKNTNK